MELPPFFWSMTLPFLLPSLSWKGQLTLPLQVLLTLINAGLNEEPFL